MFSTTSASSGMPARRFTALAATATATALALGTAPAHATDSGTAAATVLRAGLDVSLLGGTAHVPVNASLNDVKAPGDAAKTALTVTLDGVEEGRPVTILRADAATSRATADRTASKGYARLVHAAVHVPGLPLRPLVEVQQVTSEAECGTGRKPTAASNVLGSVSVLGKKVTLSATGPTKVGVPGVGDVRLDLSKTATTSRTAAATALRLDVAIDPLTLGVAKVKGTVTLVEASCETPAGTGEPAKETPATDPTPQTAAHQAAAPAKGGLAETGGSSATPYLAGAAGLLVVGGGGALLAARRRKDAAHGND
ncbi:SCO1860 family LAETG-anchored protein [Streptomyces cinnamoneus]|uniref:LPXTG cell wall anchor domain-containing protein n=1 Tax=Streptomyces cinnamoneus TaxID=53446 RepID=A0A918TQJ2_STRCJ|nr:SCO1860 family LAETG-anchored protein [Streptomyces cinnamoneus]GHC56572.1 LPXTG cell wall anchor domain-containing protein [Streptomyces cinnamoneus]